MTRNIAQLPNNNYTPETASVYTTTGFNAGDLVYFQNGTYLPATSLTGPSNASFSTTYANTTSSFTSTGYVGNVFPPTNGGTSPVGGTANKFAATLSNGNIAQVWIANSYINSAVTGQGVYFQIVSTTGTVLYGPTLVSSTYTALQNGTASVIALTGGGFVVYFADNNNYITYGIYTNTGTVTTAVQQDTGSGNIAYGQMNGVALANGGFAIAYYNAASGYYNLRSYNATGTGAYSWVQVSTGPNFATYQFGMASRSDNSVAISFFSSSTNIITQIYNSSGSNIANPSFTVNGTTIAYCVDTTCLADGTTLVVGYYNYISSPTNAFYPAFRLIPTGNTVGSEIAIPYQNLQYYYQTGSGPQNFISLMQQSGGGFVFAFTDLLNGIQYAFFNASGTAVSGTNTNGTLPILVPGGFVGKYGRLTMIEISGYVNLYWTSSNPGNSVQQANINQNYAQINETTYKLVPFATTNIAGSNITAASSTISLSTLTPTSAKFYAASTATYTTTVQPGLVVGPTVVYSANICNSISSCTLPNGQFLIAYMDNSTYVVYVAVYSQTGILQQTITVGTATGASYTQQVKIAALSSGKFVVAWQSNSSGTAVNLSLYSSTFTLISTVSAPTLYSAVSGTLNFAVAGLAGSDRYVFVYIGGGSQYPYYTIYSNTNSVVVSPTVVASGNGVFLSVAPDANGGFAVLYSLSNTAYITAYNPNTSTTYTNNYIGQLSPGGGGFPSAITYANNAYYTLNNPTGTNVYCSLIANSSAGFFGKQATTSALNNSFTPYAIGYSGTGQLVVVNSTTSTASQLIAVMPGLTYGSSTAGFGTQTGTNIISLPSNFACNSGYGYQYSISPSYGNNVLITWLDANAHPNFAIYNPTSYTQSFTITAGSTLSNTVSIYPNNSTASGVLPNTILAGVALTNASANSTGQLLINGITQLNSSYTPITYQAFDHTGQAIDGVKGIVNGLQINLQGNS